MGYAYYNLNPYGKSVGDCTVRALSKALGQTWDTIFNPQKLEPQRLESSLASWKL